MPLAPDNRLISPTIRIASGVDSSTLSFYIRAQASGYENENIGVYVSMDGGQTWGDELGYFTTIADYVRCEVDLSDYAGLDIRVAFRHYNSSNQFIVDLDCVQIANCQISDEPTPAPTAEPTEEPTAEPTTELTAEPTAEPTTELTAEPTAEPTTEPTAEPSEEPTAEPTGEPTDAPIVPGTGAISLIGFGLVSILAGAGVITFRKKDAE